MWFDCMNISSIQSSLKTLLLKFLSLYLVLFRKPEQLHTYKWHDNIIYYMTEIFYFNFIDQCLSNYKWHSFAMKIKLAWKIPKKTIFSHRLSAQSVRFLETILFVYLSFIIVLSVTFLETILFVFLAFIIVLSVTFLETILFVFLAFIIVLSVTS